MSESRERVGTGLSRRRYLGTLAATTAGLAVGTNGATAQDAVPASQKRGYIGGDPARAGALGAAWFYDYSVSHPGPADFDAQFLPMINGDDLWWTSGASDQILASDYGPQYVLGYNEPEHEEGYTDVQTILDPHWRTLCDKFRDSNIAVCSPSIKTGTSTGRTYLDDFMTAVENDSALYVDELAVHWYAGTQAMIDDPVTQADWFLSRLDSLYSTYGRPIWITEFGGPNFANLDADALAQSNITFLQETIPALENRSYVQGYAWWEGGRATQLTEVVDGSAQLTDVGRAYVGLDSSSGFTPGRYRIENVNSGKVLDVNDQGTANGDDVVQWDWWGGDNQQWDAVENGDGTVRLENVNSGKVLDVSDQGTANGDDVVQWDWWGGDNQRWNLYEE